MKKLMIAAAAAALVGGAYASCSPSPLVPDCTAVVFTLKGSGKISAENSKDTYKTNAKISPKGYLVINADYSAEILASLKYRGEKALVGLGDSTEVTQLGAYGKNLAKLQGVTYKPGKTYKMESDLGVAIDDNDFIGYMSTFGSVKFSVSKKKVTGSACGPTVTNLDCQVTWTPVKYSGYFAGEYIDCTDEEAPLFTCAPFALTGKVLYGGKVTLKYTKSIDSEAEAVTKFLDKYFSSKVEYIGGTVLDDAEIDDDEDEDEDDEDLEV